MNSFSGQQIEALAHGCAACGSTFVGLQFCLTAYRAGALHGFDSQIEIGLVGGNVRNIWTHLDCKNPTLEDCNVQPDIHKCIRCKKALDKQHVIQPVFRVDNPRMVNPNDPTDVGLSLGDRVYFVHAECQNPRLDGTRGNILL